jgi:hypothetical protein
LEKRSNRAKKQAMVEFHIEKDLFGVNFFVSPQLVIDAIQGFQSMKENCISLNFEKGFTYVKKGLVWECPFYQLVKTLKVQHSDQFSGNTDIPSRSYTD